MSPVEKLIISYYVRYMHRETVQIKIELLPCSYTTELYFSKTQFEFSLEDISPV